MPINSFSRGKTFTQEIKPSFGNDLVPLLLFDDLYFFDELPSKSKILSSTRYLKTLKAFATLDSLPKSSTAQYSLIRNNNQPRKQLSLYLSSSNLTAKIVSLSLFKDKVDYNLLDLLTNNLSFEIDSRYSLFFQFENVGYGLPSGSDTITIYGTYVEEFTVFAPHPIYDLPSLPTPPDPSNNLLINNSAFIDNDFLIKN